MTKRQIQIIEAAGKILTRSGINGLTIKNLALEMDFSEGAIYRHFRSKEEIVLSMLEYLAENMDSRLGELSLSGLQPPEKLLAVFQNQLEFFSRNPHFVVVVFSDGLMEESEKISDRILKIMAVKMRHLLPIVLDGQLRGFFTKAINSEEISQITMGSFRLQMFKWRSQGFSYDIEENGIKIIKCILKIIRQNN